MDFDNNSNIISDDNNSVVLTLPVISGTCIQLTLLRDFCVVRGWQTMACRANPSSPPVYADIAHDLGMVFILINDRKKHQKKKILGRLHEIQIPVAIDKALLELGYLRWLLRHSGRVEWLRQ